MLTQQACVPVLFFCSWTIPSITILNVSFCNPSIWVLKDWMYCCCRLFLMVTFFCVFQCVSFHWYRNYLTQKQTSCSLGCLAANTVTSVEVMAHSHWRKCLLKPQKTSDNWTFLLKLKSGCSYMNSCNSNDEEFCRITKVYEDLLIRMKVCSQLLVCHSKCYLLPILDSVWWYRL